MSFDIGRSIVNSHFARGRRYHHPTLPLSKEDLKAAEPNILMVAGYGKHGVERNWWEGSFFVSSSSFFFKKIRSRRSFRRKRCPYARIANTLIFQLCFLHYHICISNPSFVEKVLINILQCQLDEKGFSQRKFVMDKWYSSQTDLTLIVAFN